MEKEFRGPLSAKDAKEVKGRIQQRLEDEENREYDESGTIGTVRIYRLFARSALWTPFPRRVPCLIWDGSTRRRCPANGKLRVARPSRIRSVLYPSCVNPWCAAHNNPCSVSVASAEQ